MVNIICMKWGTLFGPETVNRLGSMVRRHIKRPHRFVCFTDNPAGIDSEVEIRPIPAFPVVSGPDRCWRKIATFGSPLSDLKGPTLFLDLDIVIVDSLDPFFDYPGEVCIIKEWARPNEPTGNSSVYRFEAGAHPYVLERFVRDHDSIRHQVSNEQEYISREIAGRGTLTYWPDAWCPSFKHHCLPRFPMNWLREAPLPAGARVVIFHGHPKPDEAAAGCCHKLWRKVRPTQWVARHYV